MITQKIHIQSSKSCPYQVPDHRHKMITHNRDIHTSLSPIPKSQTHTVTHINIHNPPHTHTHTHTHTHYTLTIYIFFETSLKLWTHHFGQPSTYYILILIYIYIYELFCLFLYFFLYLQAVFTSIIYVIYFTESRFQAFFGVADSRDMTSNLFSLKFKIFPQVYIYIYILTVVNDLF